MRFDRCFIMEIPHRLLIRVASCMDMIGTATKFRKEAQGRDVDINKVIEAGQQHRLLSELFILFG